MNGARGGLAARALCWAIPVLAPSAPGTAHTARHNPPDSAAASETAPRSRQLGTTGSGEPPVMPEKYGRKPAAHTASAARNGAIRAAAATVSAPSARCSRAMRQPLAPLLRNSAASPSRRGANCAAIINRKYSATIAMTAISSSSGTLDRKLSRPNRASMTSMPLNTKAPGKAADKSRRNPSMAERISPRERVFRMSASTSLCQTA